MHHYAVVPPYPFSVSRDVLPSHSLNRDTLPFTTGMSILTYNYGDTRALPLYYVSHAVALDRSPKTNPANPAGVEAGWYVVPKPGAAFRVEFAPISAHTFNWKNDVVVYTLMVNGRQSCEDVVVPLVKAGSVRGGEFEHQVVNGFTKLRFGEKSQAKLNVSRFSFASSVSDDCEARDSQSSADDTIRLKTAVAMASWIPEAKRKVPKGWRAFKKGLATTDSAIHIVSSDEPLSELEPGSGSNYQLEGLEQLPEQDIVIHVRTSAWMRSRKLFDSLNSPCSYQTFRALQQAQLDARSALL